MDRADLQRSNRALLVRLCVVVLAMFGFGFALVPFYEKNRYDASVTHRIRRERS